MLLLSLCALSEVSQPSRQECGLSATARLSQSQFNSQLPPSQRNWGKAMAKIWDRKGSLALSLPRADSKAWQLQSTGGERTSCVFN